MQLYNVQGKLIKNLINKKQGAGAYTLVLPSILSQGEYILTYKAGRETFSMPILLAR